MDLITRQEALAQGLKWYFTGVPCKHGHVAKMRVHGGCAECIRRKNREWHNANKEAVAQRKREWHNANKEAVAQRKKASYAVTAEHQKEKARAWRMANKERQLESQKRYARENVDAVRAFRNEWHKARRAADPAFALLYRLRKRLCHAIDGNLKAASTMELLGCTSAELLVHIEAQFLPGMTWENRSEWTLDHILPCAAFDMLDPIHQRACFHYTNLQPLWSVDNIRKGDDHDPAEVAAWVERFS